MTKNYLSLDLGGKKLGWKVNFGTLNHMAELTKEDPLAFAASMDLDNLSKIFNFTYVIVHAGLLSNCDAKGVEPDFTAADVKKWIVNL